MMRMKIVVVLVVYALSTLSLSFAAEPEKIEKVVATGIGINLDKAKQNAIRNAVEQVIGTYVSSDTLVKNNQVIKDQILSYSGGYLKEMKVLSEEKTDDGLFSAKIEALVISTKLKRKIESLNIAVKKLEGESLFSEAFSKIELKKSSGIILAKAFSKYPKAAYELQIGKPKIISTNSNTNTANIEVPIVYRWDQKFLSELEETLKQISFDKYKNISFSKVEYSTYPNISFIVSKNALFEGGFAENAYFISRGEDINKNEDFLWFLTNRVPHTYDFPYDINVILFFKNSKGNILKAVNNKIKFGRFYSNHGFANTSLWPLIYTDRYGIIMICSDDSVSQKLELEMDINTLQNVTELEAALEFQK